MTPLEVKTKMGQEQWCSVEGASLVQVDAGDVPALIQKKNTEKLVRTIDQLMAAASLSPQ
jgi:hypothetical protein